MRPLPSSERFLRATSAGGEVTPLGERTLTDLLEWANYNPSATPHVVHPIRYAIQAIRSPVMSAMNDPTVKLAARPFPLLAS